MNAMEKAIWAASFEMSLAEFSLAAIQHKARLTHPNPPPPLTENEIHFGMEKAVEKADITLMHIRGFIEKRGRFHAIDDLEVERLEELGITPEFEDKEELTGGNGSSS